jgi:hypothetical protein
MIVPLIEKSKGEIVEVQGLKMRLPKKPLSKNILFSKRKKKNQKWEVQEVPEDCTRDNYSKFSDYIISEFKRIDEGVWFMNNGEATYLTGEHYYYLNYIKIDVGPPEYRDRDRKLFYYWEACKQDKRCLGMTLVKPRRMGASWIGSSMLLYGLTRVKNSLGGVLSKTGLDAKTFFTDKVVFAFRRLPWFLQPIQDGTTNPKMALSFSEPARRLSSQHKHIKKSEALNSKIEWRNTTQNSFDSTKLKLLVFDEVGKIDKEIDLNKMYQIISQCLVVGRKVVGKAFLPSTVNDLDEGGDQFKNLFEASDNQERNENGMTKTGLYSYFVPAYDGLEGFIDEYGYSVIDDPKKKILDYEGYEIEQGSKNYLKKTREGLKTDNRRLHEHKRQYPWHIKEAFYRDIKTATFDLQRIQDQIDYNQTATYPLFTKGNFIWKNGQKDTEVIWVPHTKGKFKVTWLPDKKLQNNIDMSSGRKKPGNAWAGCCGCDPYDLDTTVDTRRSMGAFHAYNKFTMNDEIPSNQFVCEYINRPPTAREFYEDVLMAVIFYGYPILVENNKYGIVRYFEDRGYVEYCMSRPDQSKYTLKNGKILRGIPSSPDVIQSHAQAIEYYIYNYVGWNDVDQIGNCFFDDLLEDWAEYDITKRTKYDATVSSGLALMAAQKIISKKEVVKQKPFIRRYNNAGMFSKLLK